MTPGQASSQVLALLDDAAGGVAALELSSALASTLRRSLSIVYVENTRSLVAAELPFTQVLVHAGTPWRPLSPQDVEQGFRTQAARLRELAQRIALRHAVNWSLRVVRGSLPDLAHDLRAESDLLLLGATPWLKPPPSLGRPRHARRRPVVAVVSDAGESGRRALAIATELARELAGVVEVKQFKDDASGRTEPAVQLSTVLGADLLVLPRSLLGSGALAVLRCPVLLVG